MLSNVINDGFKEIKQQRNDNLGDCFAILDKFENKVTLFPHITLCILQIYTDRGDFEAHAFEELAGIKSALSDARELRIEEDNKLIEEINKLFENLSKSDETPKAN